MQTNDPQIENRGTTAESTPSHQTQTHTHRNKHARLGALKSHSLQSKLFCDDSPILFNLNTD